MGSAGAELFTAGCAALVLLLLARSVALLPHDRTREQRWRGNGAIRPLPSRRLDAAGARVLACGLQLNVLGDATSATGNMINLLVFAGVIRCLLEFRNGRHQVWLRQRAVLYAAGMTNDWTMIGGFPVFLAAIVWLKGLSFFRPPFPAADGLVGPGWSEPFYLVLPELYSSAPDVLSLGFWHVLKANLKAQRDALSAFPRGALWSWR